MDKSCANHPESMALATCKACEKSICLMCVVDEKEGTFCSSDCHTAFANGQEVPKFVAAAVESVAPSGGGAKKIDSIFDDEPSAPPASSEELHAPPSDDPMPIVAEGTKWRPIGQQCQNHSDTPAVANCDRCSKPVCALCLLEASQGTFCSADCMGAVAQQPAAQPAPAERAALQGRPVVQYKISNRSGRRGSNTGVIVAATVILVAAAAAGIYYGWNSFSFQNTDPVKDPVVENPVTPTNPVPPEVVKVDPVPVAPEVVKPPPKNPNQVGTTEPPVYYAPRVKKQPKAVANLTRAVNPWSELEPGTWYRIRSVKGGQVTYTDIGLKEKGKDFYVLSKQTATNGQAAAAGDERTAVPTLYIRGEESFNYENQDFPCEIRSPGLEEGAAKFWTLLSGKNQGTVIKSVTPEGSFTAARVWEHAIKVKGETLECLVVEGTQKTGSASGYVKRWYCGMNPLGVVRMESDAESFALVDQGSDWSKRPAFPK